MTVHDINSEFGLMPWTLVDYGSFLSNWFSVIPYSLIADEARVHDDSTTLISFKRNADKLPA